MSPVQPAPGFKVRDPKGSLGSSAGRGLLVFPFFVIVLVLFTSMKVGLVIGAVGLVVLLVFGWNSIQAMFGWHPPRLEIAVAPYSLGSTPTILYRREPRRVVDISACDVDCRLSCIEHVTYRQGTDTRTDSRTVFETDCSGIGEGTSDGLVAELVLDISAHSGAPSFDLGNNRLTWYVEVQTRGPRLPKDKHTFEVDVGPTLDPRLLPGLQDS